VIAGGVAAVRTIAPSFSWGFQVAQSREPVFTGERKLSLAAKAGSQKRTRSSDPRLKAGYGSYAGFADGLIQLNTSIGRRQRSFVSRV
jgi:hypothetical protein